MEKAVLLVASAQALPMRKQAGWQTHGCKAISFMTLRINLNIKREMDRIQLPSGLFPMRVSNSNHQF
jgi:hypothetical protein